MDHVGTLLADAASAERSADDCSAESHSTPTLACLLDAFELDETMEPAPEYGDFWLEDRS